jgi:predicted Zn-dependent protease
MSAIRRFHSALIVLSTLIVLTTVATSAAAQAWRGQGRIAGKVTDPDGKPIEGAMVTATLPSAENRGPAPQKTNSKGDWSIGGIAGGTWALDVSKEGFITRTLSVPVSEGNRLPPMGITLEPAPVVVDPNEVIRERLTEAAALMTAQRFAEAREIYESLAKQYPTVTQFTPLLARAYYAEGNSAKAVELLQQAVKNDPAAIDVQVLLGTVLIEAGRLEEGQQVLSSIDASKVTDPLVFVNIAIGLINDKKQADAITWLDKAITVFPADPSAYYYRGISYLALDKKAEAKVDLQKFVSIAPADAPELATAKKILETLK